MEGIIYIALSLLTLGFGLAFFHEKKKRVSSKISEKQNYDEIQRFKHIYSILEKDFRALDLKNKSLKTKEAIQQLIINCVNDVLEENSFKESLSQLSDYLRSAFQCEYCAIGKLTDNILEDYVVSYDKQTDFQLCEEQKNELYKVRKANLDNTCLAVCIALRKKEPIVFFEDKDLKKDCNYHYEIYNKQVVCVEKRVDGTDCIEVPIRKALNKKMANRYLGKMIRYNTYIYSGIFFMILLVSLLFTQIKNQVFKEREYTSALNYNVVYFSDIGGDDESLKKIIPANSIKQVYIQIPFSLWYYEGKSYKPDLFPYISNVCGVEITGKSQPEKDQIIINQYVADKMIEHLECSEEELLGKSLQFNYIIDKREYPITFVIAGIAHEQDVNLKMIIYYDYNYIMNLMKSQEYYPGMSFLDYLREYHRKYAFETNESLTSYSLFDQLDSRNLDAYHSIFSHLDSRGNQKEMYQVVFQMVQIILFILTILYVFFYVIKDMKKNSTNLSILVSMHLPIGFLRWQYFRIKFLAVIIVVAFAALEIYSYGYFFEDDQIFYQYYYLMGTLFLYFIVLAFTLHRFRTSKVSDILKDSKDK